jgi:hypothetical protein
MFRQPGDPSGRVGSERLALLDADRPELIDHRPVALDAGFALHGTDQ